MFKSSPIENIVEIPRGETSDVMAKPRINDCPIFCLNIII
jgi:hypothetical protein